MWLKPQRSGSAEHRSPGSTNCDCITKDDSLGGRVASPSGAAGSVGGASESGWIALTYGRPTLLGVCISTRTRLPTWFVDAQLFAWRVTASALSPPPPGSTRTIRTAPSGSSPTSDHGQRINAASGAAVTRVLRQLVRRVEPGELLRERLPEGQRLGGLRDHDLRHLQPHRPVSLPSRSVCT